MGWTAAICSLVWLFGFLLKMQRWDTETNVTVGSWMMWIGALGFLLFLTLAVRAQRAEDAKRKDL